MEKKLKNIADPYKWSKETAQALRTGNLSAVDMDELIDEVESIASGLHRELVSTVTDIIEALIVLDYTKGDPEEANRKLVRAQGQLQLLLSSSVSLRDTLGDAIVKAYEWTKDSISTDYGISLPDRCPLPLERIVEDPYDRLVAEGMLV